MLKARLALALLAITIFGFAAQQIPDNTNDDKSTSAIRELVKRYLEARDSGDPKAIAGLFTPEADQLVSSGEWRKGRAAIVEGTVASSAKEKGQRRTIEIQSIRFVGPDVAIADGPYTLSGPTGSRNMWTTIIATRTPAGWRIAAIRNMLKSMSR